MIEVFSTISHEAHRIDAWLYANPGAVACFYIGIALVLFAMGRGFFLTKRMRANRQAEERRYLEMTPDEKKAYDNCFDDFDDVEPW